MEESLFRKKSIDRISSPEQLNDYMHVTSPTVWVILAAVIILLAVLLVWTSLSTLDSYAAGTAQAEGGVLAVYFENTQIASQIEPGMNVLVGDDVMVIRSVGNTSYGVPFAVADTTLADGTYPARIAYKKTQLIRLLLG